MPPLRVAVIGAGAFGRNHLRVYRELEQSQPTLVQLAALVEPNPTRRANNLLPQPLKPRHHVTKNIRHNSTSSLAEFRFRSQALSQITNHQSLSTALGSRFLTPNP